MMIEPQLSAEQRARVQIDRQLTEAGWAVQSRAELNLFAGPGVAVREVIMRPGHGRADYLLYVDRRAVGVIEAKPECVPLSGVEWQSALYADGLPADVRLRALTRDGRLPFVFECSGAETHLTDGFDPVSRARRVFAVPQPPTLARAVHNAYQDARYAEVLAELPDLATRLFATADLRVLTAGWTVVAKALTKVGAFDLALLAADRARESARQSGDAADLGMATYQVVCAVLGTAQAVIATDLAERTATNLGGTDDDAVRSVTSALRLIAAIAARGLDIERFAPALRSRRVQVGLDVAWAHTCRHQDADSVLALLDVERQAPEVTRHNVYARSTIGTLLGRARGPSAGHVRALAARSGVAL